MADAVVVTALGQGPRNAVYRLTNISDGTGENKVLKIDLSDLSLGNGEVPTKTQVAEIQWSIQGFYNVILYWDHTTDDVMAVLAAGNGYRDYVMSRPLPDPQSAGGTGDVLLSTTGAVSGASYDILLTLHIS